jgi:hypothetical protein
MISQPSRLRKKEGCDPVRSAVDNGLGGYDYVIAARKFKLSRSYYIVGIRAARCAR